MAVRTIEELTTRRTICDQVIRKLMVECAGDPRQPSALAHYRAQLAALDAELTEALRLARQAKGEPEPPPVVVGLKAAQLVGQTR